MLRSLPLQTHRVLSIRPAYGHVTTADHSRLTSQSRQSHVSFTHRWKRNRYYRQNVFIRHAARFSDVEETPEPETATEAITEGLKLYHNGQYTKAMELFKASLDLPGKGIKRYRNKPSEASLTEKIAALYNVACCYSAQENVNDALVALAACLELGYDDFNGLRTDIDLEFIRLDPRFEGLLARFEPKGPIDEFLRGFRP